MSVTGKIWRGTVWTSGANILARIGTFLGNLAIIRLLGLDLVGELGLIESWLGLITMFSVLGLNLAATKYISHYLESDKDQIGGIIATTLVLGGSLGVLVSAMSYFFLTYLPENLLLSGDIWITVGLTLKKHIFVLLGLILITTYRQLMTGLVFGLQAFYAFVAANMIVGIVSFPLSYLLTDRYGLAGALMVRLLLLILEILVLIYGLRQTLRRLGIRLKLHRIRQNTKQLFGFGLPAFIGQIIANPVQTFMLSLVATQPNGLGQLGLLTVGQRLTSLTSFLPNAMASTVMPILSTEWGRGDSKRFNQGVISALRMLWLSSFPIIVFFFAATPTLLGLLFGSEYLMASTLTAFLLLIRLLGSINETGDRILAAANRMWLSTANNLFWMVLFLALALILIPRNQALGYVIAYLLSFALYVILQMSWLRYLFHIKVRPLLPMITITILFLVFAWAIFKWLSNPVQLLVAMLTAVIAVITTWRYFLFEVERQSLLRLLSQFRPVAIALDRFHSK